MNNTIARRSALRMLGAGAAALCPICLSLGARAEEKAAHGAAAPAAAPAGAPAAHGAAAPAHWEYGGEAGPGNWGKLSADFKVCELGLEQTPIDLTSAVRAEVGGVEPNFQEMPLAILNNGHTIQVNCAPGSGTRIGGQQFDLLQFHFHHPSEHLLSGKAFDLELHFVHKSAVGQLAVLGVFMRPGAENYALQPVWAAMPAEAGPEKGAGTSIRPADLLPPGRGYFRYQGSLTTPPCSEGVLWTVFKDPIEVSEAQVRQFAALFANNARPAQRLNRRFLLDTL